MSKEPGALHIDNFEYQWHRIRTEAGLSGLRIHDLQHTYASRVLALGESLPGKLLGHTQVETTARYAHLARDSVQEPATRIADSIAADILGDDVGAGFAIERTQ